MNRRLLIASAALLLSAGLPASAEKLFLPVKPAGLKGLGFTLTATRRGDGSVHVRITRDLSKAVYQGRHADLKIQSEAGLLAECDLAESRDLLGEVVYRFTVAERHLPGTVFTFSEFPAAGTQAKGFELLGDGRIYTFRLADFPVSR